MILLSIFPSYRSSCFLTRKKYIKRGSIMTVNIIYQYDLAEHHSPVGITTASYFGSLEFKSCLGYWLSPTRIFVVFLSVKEKCKESTSKSDHGHFLRHPFQFIVYLSHYHLPLSSRIMSYCQ